MRKKVKKNTWLIAKVMEPLYDLLTSCLHHSNAFHLQQTKEETNITFLYGKCLTLQQHFIAHHNSFFLVFSCVHLGSGDPLNDIQLFYASSSFKTPPTESHFQINIWIFFPRNGMCKWNFLQKLLHTMDFFFFLSFWGDWRREIKAEVAVCLV